MEARRYVVWFSGMGGTLAADPDDIAERTHVRPVEAFSAPPRTDP
jgi:hypothetical protein